MTVMQTSTDYNEVERVVGVAQVLGILKSPMVWGRIAFSHLGVKISNGSFAKTQFTEGIHVGFAAANHQYAHMSRYDTPLQ